MLIPKSPSFLTWAIAGGLNRVQRKRKELKGIMVQLKQRTQH
ncbi:hypothetical protein HHE03_17540 [Helicobacter heilmannii]|nr:hypothetical protein HHE014_14870 [Helicobacter heilmannii]CRF50058.1 hypothetical protein HHE03_17540 [Helicobacter heilmannii]